MTVRDDLAAALAASFLSGEWTHQGLVDSGSLVLRRRAPWLPLLSRQVLEVYRVAPLDRPRELAAVVLTRPALDGVRAPRPRTLLPVSTRMVTNPWHLPVLHDLADLAHLLGLPDDELVRLADLQRTRRRGLGPYRTSWRTTATGAVRVLEAPTGRLKGVQRRLLEAVLDGIPPHDAAHGFRRGRSALSHASVHAGSPVVVRLDLESFFASVPAGRVYGVLRTAGYPEPVAHALTGLVTTTLPLADWRAVPRPTDPGLLAAHWRLGRRLAVAHLPQGAPTSPALANLAAHHLDVRLTALAASWGGRYSRYADDLALSGDRGWGRRTSRLLDLVEEVVREEGFRLHARKTAVLPSGGRQVLGGLVVNERPRVARAEVDRLRAVLHNCARYGPSTQNRTGRPDLRAHLLGRIAWVAESDPVRGRRLRAQFDAISWER